MIIAVPEQHTGIFSGIGIPEHTAVITWYRWWCTDCQVGASRDNAWSHAISALGRGEYHERVTQCQKVGQLELFAVGGAR